MEFCPHCGTKISQGAHYCVNCGTAIDENCSHGTYDVAMTSSIKLVGTKETTTDIVLYVPHLRKSVHVAIPNSIKQGGEIRLRGLGRTAANGEKGDLFVKFDVVEYLRNTEQGTDKQDTTQTKRDFKYAGTLMKCPNCGEVLNSFTANCPSCGYELRGVNASETVREFAQGLERSKSTEKRAVLIKNYPIPNSKEGIIEFLVLASTNVLGETNQVLFDAWLAKVEQCWQKAVLILDNEEDIGEIRIIYNRTYAQINKEKSLLNAQRREKKASSIIGGFIKTIVYNLGACCGIIALFIALDIDKKGGNASMVELIGCALIIVSACILIKRNASLIDYGICAASGGATLILAKGFDNGSMLLLTGVAALIITAVNYFKKLTRKTSQPDGAQSETDEIRFPRIDTDNAYVLKTKLEQKGFTNITMVNLRDVIFGIATKQGSVESVMVNGKVPWPLKSYSTSAPIIITYHGRPQE